MNKYLKLIHFCIVMLTISIVGNTLLSPVYALEWEKITSPINTLNIKGTCKDENITIYLYSLESNNSPIYSAGTKCKNGGFKFSDNLEAWNIKDNTYRVVVGEGQNNPKFSQSKNIDVNMENIGSGEISDTTNIDQQSIEITESQELVNTELTIDIEPTQPTPEEQFTQGLTNFNTNLTNTTESFNNMKDSIDATDYPEYLKVMIKGFLSGIESTLGNLNSFTFKIFAAFVNKDTLVPPIDPNPKIEIEQEVQTESQDNANETSSEVAPL